MLTFPNGAEIVRDGRAAYRPFRVTVSRIADLSPSFRRITFTGDELGFFAEHAKDQRVKIVFPIDGIGYGELGLDDPQSILEGSWYSYWRALGDDERNPFRTYTVRAVRPQSHELDIDFVSHGDGGPAARWLLLAEPGDDVIIVGPDARSTSSHIGMDWHPGDATDVLLAGDETAAPAICGILESLGAEVRATAFIEVPTAADILTVISDADVTITWLARDSAAPNALQSAVRAWTAANSDVYACAVATAPQELEEIDVDVDLLWDSPDAEPGDFYAWLAGESAMIKSLRRLLVTELGIDRHRVAFMGYWRQGKSEAQG